MKESFTVNSLCVISDRTGTKNFASLYVGVPITERIGINGGNPFIMGLCTLADAHHMMFIYTIVRIQFSFVQFIQFSLLWKKFCILSKKKKKCKSIYHNLRRGHESSNFLKLARNKWNLSKNL